MPRTEQQKVSRLQKDRADRADPVKGPKIRAQVVECGKRWRERHADEDRRRQRGWRVGTPGGMVATARESSKARGLDFAITKADVRIPSRCPVLGIPLDPSAAPRSANLPSLDRIDPRLGYVPGNVWVISWRANMLKHNATLEDLEALVRAMKTHNFRSHAHAWFQRKAA